MTPCALTELVVLTGATGVALLLIGVPRLVQVWLAGRRVVREAEEITTTGDLLHVARAVQVVPAKVVDE